jgi:hypothetical protein
MAHNRAHRPAATTRVVNTRLVVRRLMAAALMGGELIIEDGINRSAPKRNLALVSGGIAS